jgi:hypothetical protein
MRGKDAPLLQRVGSELREENPDIFVECVEQQILDEKPKVAILPDMRYPNEYGWIKSHGGITVKVSRYNPDGSLFVDPSRPADHASEIALDGFDFDYFIQATTGELVILETLGVEIWCEVLNRLKAGN